MDKISENLSKLREEIAPYKPTIVAVTKYYDESMLIKAYEAGIRDFGESRVQDALEKIEKLPQHIKEKSRFHLIGHLQTNKVKKAVGIFSLIHSVDSVKVAEAISQETQRQSLVQDILLQINNANEESKFGFLPSEIESAFAQIQKLPGIRIQGLMTIAPHTKDERLLRTLFQEIVQIKDKIINKFGYNLYQMSMGMSNDFRIALEEGSTIIRVGRKLFS